MQVNFLPCRALARLGNAYHKKDDLKNALIYFNKSLSEYRDPEVVKKTHEVCFSRDFHHDHSCKFFEFLSLLGRNDHNQLLLLFLQDSVFYK